jgi:regulator of replication initiation timing
MDITKYMSKSKPSKVVHKSSEDDDDNDEDDRSVSSSNSRSSIFARMKLLKKAKSHADTHHVSDDASTTSSRSSLMFKRRRKSKTHKNEEEGDEDASTAYSFFFRKNKSNEGDEKSPKDKREKKPKKSKRAKSPKRDGTAGDSTMEFRAPRSTTTTPGATLDEVMNGGKPPSSKSKDGSSYDHKDGSGGGGGSSHNRNHHKDGGSSSPLGMEKKQKRKGKHHHVSEKEEPSSDLMTAKIKSLSDHFSTSPSVKKKKKDKLSVTSDHSGKKKKKQATLSPTEQFKKGEGIHSKGQVENHDMKDHGDDVDDDDDDEKKSVGGSCALPKETDDNGSPNPARRTDQNSMEASSDDDDDSDKGEEKTKPVIRGKDGDDDDSKKPDDTTEKEAARKSSQRLSTRASIPSTGSLSGMMGFLRRGSFKEAPKEAEKKQARKTLFAKGEDDAAPSSPPSLLNESISKIRASLNLGGATRRDSVEEGADGHRSTKKRFSKLWGAGDSSNNSMDFGNLDNVNEDEEDGDDNPQGAVRDNKDTRRQLRLLRSDNVNLRSQLDWTLQQLEELSTVQSKLDKLQKEHTLALQKNETLKQKLEDQEATMLEKDMHIMTLEESDHGVGDEGSEAYYSPSTPTSLRRAVSNTVATALRTTCAIENDNEDNDDLQIMPQLKRVESEHSWRPTARSTSPVPGQRNIPSWRADKSPLCISPGSRVSGGNREQRQVEELEAHLEAKAKQMQELEQELQRMKQDWKDLKHRPLTALVEENKSLRDEVAKLKIQARQQVAAQHSASDSVGSDVTDQHSDEDSDEIEDLHIQLREEGITPTLALERDHEALRRVSVLSCGDHSYMADLQNQLETKDEMREEEMIEEAQERYKKILEEKGLPEDEDLLCSILEEVIAESKDANQKADRFLTEKIAELKARLKSANDDTEDHCNTTSNADRSDKEERKLESEFSKLKTEIGSRKSFDFRGLVREVGIANDAGDDLAKELKDANEKLKEREKEINDLQTTITEMNRKTEHNPSQAKEQKGWQRMLEQELDELRNRLYEKDEAIASMHSEIKKLGETQDWTKRITELEQELQKERDEKKELKIDLIVAKADLEEIRECGSQKSYFSSPDSSKRSAVNSTKLGRQDTTSSNKSYFTARSTASPKQASSNDDEDEDEDDGAKHNGYMKSYFDHNGSPKKQLVTAAMSDLLADEDGDNHSGKDDQDMAKSKMEGVLGQMMKGYFGSSSNSSSNSRDVRASPTPQRPTADLPHQESSSPFLGGFFGGKATHRNPEPEKQEEPPPKSKPVVADPKPAVTTSWWNRNPEAQKSAIEHY